MLILADHLICLQFSFICALLIFMLDYGLGKPGDENFNKQALLFRWSFFLAKKRLKKNGAWKSLYAQHSQNLTFSISTEERLIYTNNFKMIVFQNAQPFFTYEMILGMCPVCTHLWVTLSIFLSVDIFYFSVNIFIFMHYLSFSHLLIRLFKRI